LALLLASSACVVLPRTVLESCSAAAELSSPSLAFHGLSLALGGQPLVMDID
jgi:hypothetical protein